MKDKLSKVKNLIKKYGLIGTIMKLIQYISANYLARISIRERLHVALHKKQLIADINAMLDTEEYDRIVVWRSTFGWTVPLYQRPQHIFSNFAKQRTLVLYEVTKFTDDVHRMEKIAPNLYLVNFANSAYSKLLMEVVEQRSVPRYVQFYSTDWVLPRSAIEDYMARGYKVVYEYIDDLSPQLAGTDSLPVNVQQKYEMMLETPDIFTVVTADALHRDVVSKRGDIRLAFSGNGVDYDHFHNHVDPNYPLDEDFRKVLALGRPLIGYYGAMAKWTDYELLKAIARTGKYEVVLFGIAYDETMEQSGLTKMKHVHFMGPRDYSVLQHYAAHIDVLTIPFLINDITRATSPVKLFEYMALNKPIVTTDMDECRKYKSVLIGHDHAEFIARLDKALSLREDADYMALLNKEALENTWAAKAKTILDMLKAYE